MFAPITPYAGVQPFNDWFDCDTTQRAPLGTAVDAVDPFWGQGRFIYLKSNDAILKGSAVFWDESHNAALLPSATLQGFPFAISMTTAPSGEYFWAQTQGRAVYKTNATVAADGILAIAAAGILGATATGKQVLGIRNRKSATGTETLTNGNIITGQAQIFFPGGYDGAFLGAAITGSVTGIPASSIVVKLGSDGKTVYLGDTVGATPNKLATATTTIPTVTITYTGYGSGILQNPSCMVPVA